MKARKCLILFFCLCLAATMLFVDRVGIQPARAQFGTTITVTTTRDPDNSNSTTCATPPCTLRRAIVQARLLPEASRPVLINFNIPTSDVGYDSSLQIWKFNDFKVATIDAHTIFRAISGGSITIDGTTQPGGRTNGPKLILTGPGDGSNEAFNLSGSSANAIRGLAFQNWHDSITVTSTNSVIENNWFGLNDTGTLPYWRDVNDHSQGSGANGVVLYSGASNNLIRYNTFLGLNGTAATIRDNFNTFSDNKVGATAAGTTPGKTTDPGLLCTQWDWYGGSGIRIDGDDHTINNNFFTGIRLDLSGTAVQPEAIYIGETCDRVKIWYNTIGEDSAGKDQGVCGRGINVFNSKALDIKGNILADTYNSAIFLNGSLYGNNKISQNIIRKSTPWIWQSGAPKGDDAILRFTGLPDSLEFFNPAKITSINGKLVTGTSGTGNPCPGCTIELFLDDTDGINEALQYLGSVVADSNGNWSFMLTNELTRTQGLRTSSTTNAPNVIPGFSANTTVGLSEFYYSGKQFLPFIKR